MRVKSNYQPPHTITPEILNQVAAISESVGRLTVISDQAQDIQLRRINQVRIIHGSLAIEGNTLSEAQITAILEGKRVIAPPREVQEVKNALAIIIKEIHSYYKIKALAAGIKNPKSGAISSTQLAGSALNLNPHLHILFCDGVFSGTNQNGAETFRFRNLEAITDKEVEKLLLEISSKVLKLLKKHGYLNH